jgi:ATP-dependent protease HslVU (ClpYQ) ATPase subunit
LLDGTDVNVSEGHKKHQVMINTRNILFVVLGAFAKNKPTDLIVEVFLALINRFKEDCQMSARQSH